MNRIQITENISGKILNKLKESGIEMIETAPVSEFGIEDDSSIMIDNSSFIELRPTAGLVSKDGLAVATSTLSEIKISAEKIDEIEKMLEIVSDKKLFSLIEDPKVSEVKIPHLDYVNPAYEIIASAEASSNLARYNNFSNEMKGRMLFGAYLLLSSHKDNYYQKALEVRQLIKKSLVNFFNEFDLIVVPNDPIYNRLIALTGLPSVSIESSKVISNSYREKTIFEFVKRWNT